MQLIIEDRRDGGRLPLTLESWFVPPWGQGPGDLVTFEGYHAALKGAEAADLRLQGFLLETYRGWVVGSRRTLRLPQAHYLNFDDLLSRVWPKHKEGWRHTGVTPNHPLVAVIPPGLPGAGMVVVRNLSQLSAVPLTGTHLEQEQARRTQDRANLLALGYEERDSAEHGGTPQSD